MGDVGYFDDRDRFWYCGRKSQRVETRNGPLFSIPVESVFDTLPGVRRSALVGVGARGHQEPVVVIELSEHQTGARRDALIASWYDLEPRLEKLWYARDGYVPLKAILFHDSLPVDVRHNAKINREGLAKWAETRLALGH
jgi:acyl-coenzyme A synthetase/AMP-(fatty) acid ligase